MSAPEEESADYGVSRALSVARTILDAGARGLTKAEIRDRVELYRSARDNGQSWDSWDREFSRDKRHLRACGIRIQEPQADGEDYRYTLSAEDYGLPAVSLEPQELLALERARALFPPGQVQGLEHALWALEASAGSLPARDQPAEDQPVPEAPLSAMRSGLGSDREMDQLLALAELGTSAPNSAPIGFNYISYGRPQPQQRRVVPLGIGARGKWYLVAHDLDRQALRTFRLDRIQGVPTRLQARDEQTQQVLAEISKGERYSRLNIRQVLEDFSTGAEAAQGLHAVQRVHADPAPQIPRLRPVTAGRRSSPAEAKIERVLNMAAYLLSAGEVPPSELLQKYGLSPRQLQRDLLSLQQVGSFDRYQYADFISVIPLPPLTYDEFVQDYLGADAPIRLVDGSLSQDTPLARPVSLTKPGALALLIALQTLIDLDSEPRVRKSAHSLHTKILDLVPGAIAETARNLAITDGTSGAVVAQARAAINAATAAQLEYLDAEGQLSFRTVDPVQLIHDGPRTYVRAWCRSAEGERLFRVDRIRSLQVLPQLPRCDSAALLPRQRSSAASVPRTEHSVEAVLKFAPAAASDADAFFPERQRIQEDGSRIIATHYRSASALLKLILESGGDVELLAPQELRREVRRRAQTMVVEGTNE